MGFTTSVAWRLAIAVSTALWCYFVHLLATAPSSYGVELAVVGLVTVASWARTTRSSSTQGWVPPGQRAWSVPTSRPTSMGA